MNSDVPTEIGIYQEVLKQLEPEYEEALENGGFHENYIQIIVKASMHHLKFATRNKAKDVTITAESISSIVKHNVEWMKELRIKNRDKDIICLLYTSPSPRDRTRSRMPSSA